jgi:phosphatidate cytidylyltransferase
MQKELKKRLFTSILILPIAAFFITKGSIPFLFFLIIILLLSLFEWFKLVGKRSIKYVGSVLLFFSFYFTYFLRINFGSDIFLFSLLVCISTDLGGYIFGKSLKGPKLTKISPNKTYAGMLGGLLLSSILGSILVKSNYFSTSFALNIFLNDNFRLVIIILLISLVSQSGDLVFSYFKRLAKIKNTGNFLPGHGGILDRIDGIIFAMPFSYLLFFYINQ